MDLKLGTKQVSHDASSGKRRKGSVKAAATTSAKLGFRLGGARIYQPSTRAWAIRHGSYGKRLTEKNVQDALVFFFNDGRRTRTELIPRFVDRLKQLLVALESQRSFDFVA